MFEKRKDTVEPAPQPKQAEPENWAAKSELQSRAIATIGNTICIEGSITGSENLIINGSVKGTVSLANNDLTIGDAGKVSADLTGKCVRVDGEVTGDINGTEVVVVSKSGRVRGNIVAPRVTLEDGANFKGSIDMDPVKAEEQTGKAAAPKSADRHADATSQQQTAQA